MILPTCYGYDTHMSEITAKLGFHKTVTQEVYEQVGNSKQMEKILYVMQGAAKWCSEARIGKLIGDVNDDLDTDSEAWKIILLYHCNYILYYNHHN